MKSEASTLSVYYILSELKIHDLCEMAAAQIDHEMCRVMGCNQLWSLSTQTESVCKSIQSFIL